MCLNDVYIVLKPVGFARLKFGDDRYYEFLCFDVPKVVRSPGCDHEHDEESKNGRDVKIDILDDYIRTSERFRMIRVFFGVPESYGNSYWALMGHTGKERKAPRVAAPLPHGLVRIGLGKGAGSFLPSPSPFPFSYSMWEVESY